LRARDLVSRIGGLRLKMLGGEDLGFRVWGLGFRVQALKLYSHASPVCCFPSPARCSSVRAQGGFRVLCVRGHGGGHRV